MSAEYSRGILRILPSLPRASTPAFAQIAVPYMHRGFYDAKILTTLVVNSHNVLGSSRMKGDVSDREFTKAGRTFSALRRADESFNICYLNIQEESRRRSKTDDRSGASPSGDQIDTPFN